MYFNACLKGHTLHPTAFYACDFFSWHDLGIVQTSRVLHLFLLRSLSDGAGQANKPAYFNNFITPIDRYIIMIVH